MSGGGCSVTAALLLEQGYEVISYDAIPETEAAPTEGETVDAQTQTRLKMPGGLPNNVIPIMSWTSRISSRKGSLYLGIPGRAYTQPLHCNRHIKFGALLKKAFELGADYLATGHYAGRVP